MKQLAVAPKVVVKTGDGGSKRAVGSSKRVAKTAGQFANL